MHVWVATVTETVVYRDIAHTYLLWALIWRLVSQLWVVFYGV